MLAARKTNIAAPFFIIGSKELGAHLLAWSALLGSRDGRAMTCSGLPNANSKSV